MFKLYLYPFSTEILINNSNWWGDVLIIMIFLYFSVWNKL